ncbi:hypothetical protein SANTM175S_07374 [Streptomyces antimycoticus]
MPFRQDTSYLAIGERTNANGSKKFREAMLEARWDDCVEIAREQIREGAHLLDLCVDYVGRDGVADMEELAGRFATASTLPIVLDSTEVDVIRAGLEKLGGARGHQLRRLRGRKRLRLAVRQGRPAGARRPAGQDRPGPDLRPPREGYDPLQKLMGLFEGAAGPQGGQGRGAGRAAPGRAPQAAHHQR